MRLLLPSVVAAVGIALAIPAAGVASIQVPGNRCAKGSMHVIYKGQHKCLGVALRKLIFYDLVKYQDSRPGQDVRSYFVIAARYRIPVNAVKAIAFQGVTKRWPQPPLPR